jgi:LPXTG-motif cell wall-anchored protein
MRKLIPVFGMVASIWTVGVAPGFAYGLRPGGGAPAPEIGATALGLLLACGLAFYVLRRRQG